MLVFAKILAISLNDKKEAFHLDRHIVIGDVCWWMLVCECFSSLIQPLTTILLYTVLWEYVCISHVYVVSFFVFFLSVHTDWQSFLLMLLYYYAIYMYSPLGFSLNKTIKWIHVWNSLFIVMNSIISWEYVSFINVNT